MITKVRHATNQKDKQTEDIKEIKKILNESCEVQLNEEDVAKVISMGEVHWKQEETNHNNHQNRREEERDIPKLTEIKKIYRKHHYHPWLNKEAKGRTTRVNQWGQKKRRMWPIK